MCTRAAHPHRFGHPPSSSTSQPLPGALDEHVEGGHDLGDGTSNSTIATSRGEEEKQRVANAARKGAGDVRLRQLHGDCHVACMHRR